MRPAALLRDSRGISAVEFALTLPIFLMMLFGVVEGGRLLWAQLGLQHGTEMAARCASVNVAICGTPNDIQAYAAQRSGALNPPPEIFSVSTPACGNQVTASFPFQFLTPYFGMQTLTLSAQSCFPRA